MHEIQFRSSYKKIYFITLYFNSFLISISYIALLISFDFHIIYAHLSLYVGSSQRVYRMEFEKWRAIRASINVNPRHPR